VYGLSLPADAIGRVDHLGQTAQRITRLVLLDAGLDDVRIDEGLAAWCRRAGARYLELLGEADTSDWEPAPGAAETLDALVPRADVALLTGNPEPVARARMQRLGLDRFFRDGQGAFGCDAEDRVELIAIARRRAGDRPASETWAVGDTPRDVAGAHEAGIRCVGITSGRFGADELKDADAVIDDFRDLLRLLT
jgi:phosphoglycolate phosphatase-like HAD superfamily hydrolase